MNEKAVTSAAAASLDVSRIVEEMSRLRMRMDPPKRILASAASLELLRDTMSIQLDHPAAGPLHPIFGIPVILDPSIPEDEIEIRSGAQRVRIILGIGTK